MTEQPKRQNFIQHLWDPQGGRWERFGIMMLWVSWLISAVNLLPVGTGTAHDQLIEGGVLTLVSFALVLPLLIEGMVRMRQLKREGRELEREFRRLETKFVVYETLFEILNPEEFAAAKKRFEEQESIAKLFKAKSGPKEGK